MERNKQNPTNVKRGFQLMSSCVPTEVRLQRLFFVGGGCPDHCFWPEFQREFRNANAGDPQKLFAPEASQNHFENAYTYEPPLKR
eukprot:1193719-Amphidinium_carterae.1